jgi:hypothetical protein
MKIPGTGNGKARFNDIYPKFFQLNGEFQLLSGVELAPWNLFSITEGCIKNEYFVIAGHKLY